MNNKTLFLCILLFTLIIPAILAADFDAQVPYDWLINHSDNGSYNDNIMDTSASALALNEAQISVLREINYINSQENKQHCWPKSNCRVEDSAFALLALKEHAEKTADAVKWLSHAQTPSLLEGNWWLQIATSDFGQCKVSYKKGSIEIEKNITVEAGYFPNCGDNNWLDLKTCLEPDLLTTPSLSLYVDCSELNDVIISLIYNSQNSYYLLQDVHSNLADITVPNGCFGHAYKDICNYEATLYANWALKKVGSSINSNLYLLDNYEASNTLHNALLYIITGQERYAQELEKRQKRGGSWDEEVYNTAFAVLALKDNSKYSINVKNATDWLEDQQRSDGSFGTVLNTAMVLYAAFSNEKIDLPSCTDDEKNQGERGVDCGGPCEQFDDCCTNGKSDEGEEGVDCGGICGGICTNPICDSDDDCETNDEEDCDNCADDCGSCEDLCSNGRQDVASKEEGIDCGGECDKRCDNICDNNGRCDQDLIKKYDLPSNEDYLNCPGDCNHGDGVCDAEEKEDGSAPEDCGGLEPKFAGDEGEELIEDVQKDKKEGGTSSLLWVLLFIIIVVLVLYLVMQFKTHKKKGGPSFDFFGTSAFGGGKGKPSFPSPFSSSSKPKPKGPQALVPPTSKKSAAKQASSSIEKELEKSIGEAKKLLKK